MKMGLIADAVVVIYIVITMAVTAKRGFVRSVLRWASSLLALVAAFFGAKPLGRFFDGHFHWLSKAEAWRIPLISGKTLYFLIFGVAIFIVARLFLLILDKLLKALKARIKAVNALDRILGMILGLAFAGLGLVTAFLIIDSFELQTVLQLTPESGGYIAHHLFTYAKQYAFPWVTKVLGAISEAMPKL